MENAVKIAEKAYREYPYDWKVIDIYCRSLTKGYSEYPGGKLPELRGLCNMIMEKCGDAKIRMHAVYSMLFAEEDEYVEKWFAEVPGTYDFTEWERREDRYLERNQTEKYRKQKQKNMLQLYWYLFDKMGTCIDSPEEAVDAYRHRAALLDALFDGKNAICQMGVRAFKSLLLSSAYFSCGQKEEGYKAMEKAVQCLKLHFSIPAGTELHYEGLFDTLTIKTKENSSINSKKILSFMEGEGKMKGFALVSEEERYKALTNKVRSYVK